MSHKEIISRLKNQLQPKKKLHNLGYLSESLEFYGEHDGYGVFYIDAYVTVDGKLYNLKAYDKKLYNVLWGNADPDKEYWDEPKEYLTAWVLDENKVKYI